jgi:hypothetical protein
LHLVWVGLRWRAVEIQVQRGLVHAVEILLVREGDQPAVAEAIGLVCRQLRRSAAGQEHGGADEESNS